MSNLRSVRRVAIALIVVLAFLVNLPLFQPTTAAAPVSPSQLDSAAAVAGAATLAQQVSTQEWLGPLSAIALSPFFGLACLSGAASYGPEWLQSRSALIGTNSPLNNPLLFWTMLGLTIATSLPRFTKVSKPLAMATEKLEMYSTIIVLLAMKFLTGPNDAPSADLSDVGDTIMLAGVMSLPVDVLLSLAAAMNIIVVNTVKLAIELLVWMIPVPTIDAFLEIANKSISASLMALYVYSPMLSTLLNLLIFAACCVVFLRLKRLTKYVTELLLMPVLERIFSMQPPNQSQMLGFLVAPWNGFPAKSAFQIERAACGEKLEMTMVHWFQRRQFQGILLRSESRSALLCDQAIVMVGNSKLCIDVRKGSILPVTTQTTLQES
jgi:hypothetical protein